MSAEPSNKALHLPSLSIKGFRGIKELSIPRLGRVTLFVGKNGVGKTTLLDAVRVFAARGRYSVLADILRQHDELTDAIDEDGDEMFVPNWEALFHGWHSSPDEPISIGLEGETSPLCIRTVPISEEKLARLRRFIPEHFPDDDMKAVQIEFQGAKQEIPIGNLEGRIPFRLTRRVWWDDETQLPSEILCESLGPSLLSNTDVARFWDKVVLRDDETQATLALRLIFDSVDRVAVIGDARSVDRVAVIGDDGRTRPYYGRRAVVKLKGQERPVPLKSLGDGAVRLFGVALALANSQGGFLVIDEAENGIHHSVQHDFWRMVLGTAYVTNVQVIATTHSWDCTAGFAQAAADVEEVERVLIRLEEDGDQIRAVEYSEDALKIAAEQGIEVR